MWYDAVSLGYNRFAMFLSPSVRQYRSERIQYLSPTENRIEWMFGRFGENVIVSDFAYNLNGWEGCRGGKTYSGRCPKNNFVALISWPHNPLASSKLQFLKRSIFVPFGLDFLSVWRDYRKCLRNAKVYCWSLACISEPNANFVESHAVAFSAKIVNLFWVFGDDIRNPYPSPLVQSQRFYAGIKSGPRLAR